MIPTKEEWNKALCERHGEELQQKFSSATVAICGLGGLGSNITISLARAGIGKLILIDFDKVDKLRLQIEKRKALAKELKELKRLMSFSYTILCVWLFNDDFFVVINIYACACGSSFQCTAAQIIVCGCMLYLYVVYQVRCAVICTKLSSRQIIA